MALRTITITLIGFATFFAVQAQNTNFRDEYLKRYDPQGYSNLKYAEGISEQGASMANALSRNLKNYQNLVDSEDPNEILADFNAKMQQIERLEDDYIQQSNSFAFEQGQQLGSSISSGNESGAFYGAIGIIGALNKSSQAKKELEAKKAALAKQRKAAMSKVYYKAEEFNNNMIEQYIQRAAYAESLDEENYNLAFVEHLRCYGESMDKNWSSTNTYWLQNNCTKPRRPSSSGIENKFVARDVQLGKIAERKYAAYLKNKHSAYQEAATAYAAEAVKANPSADNYYRLGDYNKYQSVVLGMTCYLAAKEADPDYFDGSRKSRYEDMEEIAEKELRKALYNNNIDYLKSFLEAGLHQTVEINGDKFFKYVVQSDRPDPLQLYLNKEFEGLSQSEIDKRLKEAIMLCAAFNSDACLQRFIELGTDVNFVLDGETPLQVADKSMSPDAYRVLSGGKMLEVDEDVALGSLSTSKILLLAQSNPQLAAKHMDAFNDGREKDMTLLKAVHGARTTSGYVEFLGASTAAQKYLKARPEYMADLIEDFERLAFDRKAENASKAILFITSGLIKFDRIPNKADLRRLQNRYIQESNNLKLAEWENKLAEWENKLAEWEVRFAKWEKGMAEKKAAADLRKSSIGSSASVTLTNELMINLLLDNMRKAYDKYASSEYATTDGKVNMRKGIDEFRSMKSRLGSLSKKDINGLHSGMFWYVAKDEDGTHAKYSIAVHDMLVSKYGTETQQPFAEQLEYLIQDLYKEKSKGNTQQSTIDWYESLQGQTPAASTQKMVSNLYVMTAIRHGKKVNTQLLAPLTKAEVKSTSPIHSGQGPKRPERPSKPYLDSENTITEFDSVNLAFHSYSRSHMELFNYLDENYDLNQVKGENGVSLFEHMLFTEFAPNNKKAELENRAGFFSKDFDFTKPINGVHPLTVYLKSDYQEGYRKDWNYSKLRFYYFFEFVELVENGYSIDLTNEIISENKGTMLHLLIDVLSKGNPSKQTIVSFIEFLEKRRIDKTTKDKLGRTAYDLYKDNKKAVNKTIVNAIYSDQEREYKQRVADLVKFD